MIQQSPTEERARLIRYATEAADRAEKHHNTEGVWLFAKQWRVVADALASQAAQPAEADGVERLREAAQGLLDACDTRSLRGRDHVPSRRAEQDARRALEKALAATPKALTSTAGEVERLQKRIAETVEEDGGCWHACSGCQEGEDGYVSARDYPYSPIFKCQPGGGCRECGGLGVLWEDGAFLASYGEALATPPAPNDDPRAALEPFAKWADEWPESSWSDDTPIPDTDLTVGNLRRARAALKENRRG